jgi:cardiolipin synthase A/B
MLAIDWLAVVVIILEVLAVLTVAVFVSANRKPSSAIAWVLAAIFIPVRGIVFFLLVGAGRLPRHRREKQRTVNETILARTEGGLDKVSNRGEWPDWLPSMVTLNRISGRCR